jgi:ATP/maltotriose-dependent transcriptional regulator MalT
MDFQSLAAFKLFESIPWKVNRGKWLFPGAVNWHFGVMPGIEDIINQTKGKIFPMDQSLLQTKFYVPNIPRGFVNRSSLNKKMDLVLEKKLCIISTPAGYGKTTLIVSWAKQKKQPLAWISLDEGDNSFQSFFAYFVTAIKEVANDFGEGLFERLVSPQSIPHELFLTLLINQLNLLKQDCVIVLDDYHIIHEKEIHEALEYLLDNLPLRIHFIICKFKSKRAVAGNPLFRPVFFKG